MTAKGIPQITKPTRILVNNFVFKCFLHDFDTVSLRNDKRLFYFPSNESNHFTRSQVLVPVEYAKLPVTMLGISNSEIDTAGSLVHQ